MPTTPYIPKIHKIEIDHNNHHKEINIRVLSIEDLHEEKINNPRPFP